MAIILKILIFLICIYLLLVIFRIIKATKNNQRISKYTITNKKITGLSFGETIVTVYYKFRHVLVNFLTKLNVTKKAIKHYEKYDHSYKKKYNSGYEILANKICLSLFLGFVYIISSLIANNVSLVVLLIYVLIGYYSYDVYLLIYEYKRNKQIENDLLKSIIIMNNAFKSGYNITQAITMVSKDLTGPISEEFAKINIDLKYGLEIKDVFERFYNRVKVKDASLITSSLSLLSLTGGNLIPIFNSIEKSFTNKKRIKDELSAMTSSSKFVYYFLLVMPIILSSILYLLSPTYFKPLITHPLGIIVILLVIILYISYIVIIRKILKVEV